MKWKRLSPSSRRTNLRSPRLNDVRLFFIILFLFLYLRHYLSFCHINNADAPEVAPSPPIFAFIHKARQIALPYKPLPTE